MRKPRQGAGIHELGRASGTFVAYENTARPDDDVQGYEDHDELLLRRIRGTTGYRPRTASAFICKHWELHSDRQGSIRSTRVMCDARAGDAFSQVFV